MSDVVTKFKPIIRKLTKFTKDSNNYYYRTSPMMCCDSLNVLKFIVPEDVNIEVHFTDSPIENISTKCTICRDDDNGCWLWGSGHIFDTSCLQSFFYDIVDRMFDKHFGKVNQIIHGWVTIYYFE